MTTFAAIPSYRYATINPLAVAWALIGLIVAIVEPASDRYAIVGVVMVEQAISAGVAWQRLQQTKTAVLPDFLTVYSLMQLLAKTLTLFRLLTVQDLTPENPVFDVDLQYLFQAELAFLAASIVFTLTWIKQEKHGPLAVWIQSRPSEVWTIFFVTSFAYGVFNTVSYGAAQELLHSFALGALAVLLGGSSQYAMGRQRAWLPLIASLPYLLQALQTGVKAAVALAALPFIFPLIRRPTPARLVPVIAFVLFVIAFVFPFSHAWREANWEAYGAVESASISTVASRVIDKWTNDGFLATAAEGLHQWLRRGASAETGGLVMSIAATDGYLGPELIKGLATIFIPRFLWPDKPLYMPGAWFTWYLGLASSPETATTATATMLPTELYWMFGSTGVIIGMIVLAMLYYYTWKFILIRASRNLTALVALFAILGNAGHMETIHTINAVSAPPITLAYVLIFCQLEDFIRSHFLSRRNATGPSSYDTHTVRG